MRRSIPLQAWLVASVFAIHLQAQAPSVTPYSISGYGQSNIVSSGGSLWYISANSSDDSTTFSLNSTTTSGSTNQYSLQAVYSPGFSVALGPDGNFWLTAGFSSTATIAMVTPTGTVQTFPIPGGASFASRQGAIAAGSDKALWFTDPSNAKVWRVTTTGAFTSFSLSNPGSGITLGPDGNIWLTEYAVTTNSTTGNSTWSGAVASVTPAGVVTEYPLPTQNVAVNSGGTLPDSFATGSDGALWFTQYANSMVGRITTSGAVSNVYTGAINGICAGPDGNLWFTQPSTFNGQAVTGGAALIQLTTSGTSTAYALSSNSFSSPNGIVSGPDGALWFDDLADQNLGRADLAFAVTTTTLPNATVGAAYSTTLQAEGGNPSYSWSAPAASLPAGLTLSTAGVLSGTPTTAGTSSIAITVTDSSTPAQTVNVSLSLVIASAPTATLTATSGSGQSAAVGTAFANPLVATVTDTNGSPLANTSVTFTAPSSGASGSFASGAVTATVSSNSSGVATSPVFTANSAAGGYSVVASTAGASTNVSFSLNNTSGVPAAIMTTSGSPQTATVGSAFASPLVVTVQDASGNPVVGASVTFTAPTSGASGVFTGSTNTASVSTGTSGTATSPIFTANSNSGAYSVTASVSGVSTNATFALTNANPTAASVVVLSGSGQSTSIGASFASPLIALVKDSSGNPVANVSVTFNAPISGASATFAGSGNSATVVTNSSGLATSPVLNADSIAGSYTVNASASGAASPAAFSLINSPGPAASLSPVAGSGQTTQINSTFATSLSVMVSDASGNAVPNVAVTFSAPTNGASGNFSGAGAVSTASSNAAGIATANAFIANSLAGTYTVTASVSGGVAGLATFSLTNAPGGPASITATSGLNQSALVNSAFSAPLVAVVRDSSGNGVANVNVVFTSPASGSSAIFAGAGVSVSVQTNSAGLATSPAITANSISGSYTISAAVGGVSAQALFPLTNNVGAPASITPTLGTNQSAKVSTAFVNPLVVLVKDTNNNPIPNATVTFTTPGTGPTATFTVGGNSTTAVTNSSGLATSPTITASAAAGSFLATASINGISTTFALANTSGAPGVITVTSGNSQTAAANSAFANPLVVTVVDANNNPVSGVTVTFTAPGGSVPSVVFGGATNIATAVTNGAGVATSPTMTANGIAGSVPIVASVVNVSAPAGFGLSITAGVPSTVSPVSGGSQSARANSAFNNPFVAVVKDASGNPVSGVTVTFSSPTSSSSGVFPGAVTNAAVTTNSSGIATSPVFTANGVVGGYSVSATVNGISTPAVFPNLSNVAGLTITTGATLTPGTVGLQYSVVLASVAGTTPYNWTVTAGALPAGLALNATTGELSGTPTASGTFKFTVTVTDSSTPAQSTSQAFSLFINPPVTQPVTPAFSFSGIPSSRTAGSNITGVTIQLSPVSSAAFTGDLSLAFTPNAAVSGLPSGYLGDIGFVASSGAKSTSQTVSFPAATTSVAFPTLDPGTVAGTLTVNLAVSGATTQPSTIDIPLAAPVIEANSVQITNVTTTGFDVEFVATSTTRQVSNVTFTFAAASGSNLAGSTTFTADVSSVLSTWFASTSGLSYGGAFSLTVPFSYTGTSAAIQSVSVALSNSVGTSAAVSGTQ